MSYGNFANVIPLIFVSAATAASLYSPIRRDESSTATSLSFNFTNAADPYNFNVIDLTGDGQIIYVANITVDGMSYEVRVDFDRLCAG